MEDEQGNGGVPPAARTFLERHQPTRNSSADHDTERDGEDDDGDDGDKAEDQHEAGGELRIEVPEISGNPSVVDNADPEVLTPPAQHFAPRRGRQGFHIHRYRHRR